MTHAETAELLGAYALDAVSPEEAAEIEGHLASCPRCRTEVAAHRDVAGVLGNLGGVAPPGLWDRIASELTIGSKASLAGTAPPSVPPPALVTPIESPRPFRRDRTDDLVAGSKPMRGGRRRAVLFSSVAALAAALAVVVGVLSSKVVSLDSRVAALSAGVLAGGVKAQVTAAELDPSHVTVSLTSASAAWSATVVAIPGGQAFLVPGKMPAIPAGETFQAWAVVGGKYISLGVLGRAPADFALQLQPGMSSVLVNAEPQGGSPQPTSAPLISGTVPKSL